MGNERRKQPRKKLDPLLEVFDINEESQLGRAVDISQGGIMVLSETPIPVNKVWQLSLDLPSRTDQHNTVFFGAESLWCQVSEKSNQYWAGFQVIDISQEDNETINEFVSGNF